MLAHKENYKDYEIQVHYDEDSINPREDYDPLGKMVCFHGRYNLGDKHDYDQNDYTSFDEMEKDIIKQENVAVILPIYMYDHSGITISTNPFSCPWDSGQIGFIYVTKEQANEEDMTKEQVEKYLLGEVKAYDAYLCGNVYGYVIEKDGEFIDSCWGFIGDEDYCIEEAKSVVDCMLDSGNYKGEGI